MPVNLRIPGPTPVPEDILQAGAKPMTNHRGVEFREMLQSINRRLQTVFQTKNDILMFTCSGTGGLEAAVSNVLSPGDKVLAVSIGAFGDRLTQIAEVFGANVIKMQVPWGKPADPDAIGKALDADHAIKAVLVTHNETSTGVTNDLQTIAKTVKSRGRLIIVDAVSSLGCVPLPVDAWQCDVVVSASQKGYMVPPGLAFVSVSQQAWDASKVARMPRFYFDFQKAKQAFQRGETPWTPALSLFFAMDLALDKMLRDGMETIYTRHAAIGSYTRKQVKALGLSLFCSDERYASNTITAVNAPPGLDVGKLLDTLRVEDNVVLAEGQAALMGKIFRIGHLGYVTEKDIAEALASLKRVLNKMGAPVA